MGTSASRIVSFVVIPVLVIAVLLLPPVSLTTRIAEIGYERLDRAGATIRAGDGMEAAVPPGAVAKNIPVRVDVVPRLDFQKQAAGDTRAAAAAFSANLKVVSPIYAIDTRGNSVAQAEISLPIPNGVEPEMVQTVDVYGWYGAQWLWIPSRILLDDDRIVAMAQPVPAAVAMVQSPAVKNPLVSASLSAGGAIDEGAKELVAELNPMGLAINTDGTIMGELSRSQWSKDDKYLIVPSIQNRVGDIYDADLVANVLQNSGLRAKLLQGIVQMVNTSLYAGVDLDIRGLEAAERAQYAAFVADLARELHKSNKMLSVTLPAATQVSDEAWKTAGYDWSALGQAADEVKIGVAGTPSDYLARLNATLAYAVSQINRSKIQVILSTYSQVSADDVIVEKAYADVLSAATVLQVNRDATKPSLTSESLTVTLPNLAEAPTWDGTAKATKLSYREGQSVRTVWLESGTSLAYKLRVVLDYGIRGVALRELLGDGNNPEIWDVVALYAQSAQVTASEPARDAVKVAWNVSGGQVTSPATGPSWLSIIWKAPDKEGSYTLSAGIADEPNSTPVPAGKGSVSIDVRAPTPTPTPLPPTPTPTRPPVPPTATARPVVAAAPAPQPVANPGFGYGVQAHMLGNDKNRVASSIVGMGFGWVKQQVEWRDIERSKGSYDWGGLDEVVNVANSKGIRVMFSVLRSPAWASAHADSPPRNFNDYGDFVGALAARYKGKGMAYEAWNEQNLKREWHEYSIDACKYVELLKIAYTRIKAADPSAVVVAGALTPTGVNDPNIAIDDRTYLQQMYGCGIRGWFDALGAHPSGFNNPPDVDWRSYSDPARPSFKGHPSFFFKATMEDYRNIMVANGDGGRPIWITEFGWAVGQPLPGYEYASQNSEGERARWFVKSYQMCKNWGFVGVVFLWNLDFRIVAPGSEQALFGILDGGFSPTATYAALRDMPK